MLSFFRRALTSWMALALLGLVLVAIAITGVGTPSSLGNLSGGGGSALAEIDGTAIESASLSERLNSELKRQREQSPGLDMAAFVRSGAVDGMLNEVIDFTALKLFGEKHGMVISKKLVDGEITGIEAFRGNSGSFDENTFRRVLEDQGIPEARFRSDLALSLAGKHMLLPITEASGAPVSLATAYAALQLEERSGQVAVVPSAAIVGSKAPTDAEIQNFYKSNAVRYTVPELRSVRYATFDKSRFDGKVAATEAEIDAQYKKDAARYAARDMRGLTQVIVQSEAAAKAVADKARAGASLADAAKGAGVEALAIKPIEKKAFATQSSEAVANAVFAAAKGGITNPVKSGLGWHVVKVDSVTAIAGKSIDAVRSEIAAELGKVKTEEAMADFVEKLETAVQDGEAFDEIAAANGLTVVTTPEMTAGGIAPAQKDYKPDAAIAPIVKEAFQDDLEDDAAVTAVGPDRFAFYDLAKVIPSAPKPLADIKGQVFGDFVADRAAREARKVAEAIAAKLNKGTPLSEAMAATGLRLPSAAPIRAKRIDLAQAKGKVPAPISMMFTMGARKAKVVEAPGSQGWFVVWLDKITPAAGALDPRLVELTRQEMRGALNKEYGDQFTAAIKKELKVERNADAIAALKRSLSGPGAQ
jgi:peptidyl-prolyl cis-trans isomerase D